MKDLKKITTIGLGLLGGSITLRVLRSFPGVKAVGYSHRPSTRDKARKILAAAEIVDDMRLSVCDADIVIIATPIGTFEHIFGEIKDSLPKGCIVTDVGSTKVLPHRWAEELLPKTVHYVGSHPIAGSEQRGIEFASDDLFEQAMCVLTSTKETDSWALQRLKEFWTRIGCNVKLLGPLEHDKIFANVSHLPHVMAAALLNANDDETLKFAGKGFIDTSRIASGPANIWSDILLTNVKNTTEGIDRIIAELLKLQKAIKAGDKKLVQETLERARNKRAAIINHQVEK